MNTANTRWKISPWKTIQCKGEELNTVIHLRNRILPSRQKYSSSFVDSHPFVGKKGLKWILYLQSLLSLEELKISNGVFFPLNILTDKLLINKENYNHTIRRWWCWHGLLFWYQRGALYSIILSKTREPI